MMLRQNYNGQIHDFWNPFLSIKLHLFTWIHKIKNHKTAFYMYNKFTELSTHENLLLYMLLQCTIKYTIILDSKYVENGIL